ncbi:uncharacterized protein [Arachis hypogaea]|uniref:uncharacterized protein n=1 Tax=Arachis hypogaea TaxID=3818 RepID=UPI003B219DC0
MANVRPHEPLKLYIVASTNTIRCMLAQDDENGHERAIYYLSRVLTDIETRYSPIERLCLSLYYASKTAKGQVIAYFLVDNSKKLNDQGANALDVKVDYWKLYFDGLKHKDGAGVGILIISPEGIPSELLFELKYPCLNNMAEYEALVLGLKILIGKGASEVQILGDFQLVLKQISKEFKCNNEKLQKYLATTWELLTSFQRVSLGDNDWRKPIAEYLRNPNIRVDRRIKSKAMNFVLMADELYKKGIDGILSRCRSQDDKDIALGEVHKDCIDYAKACQKCQRHGVVQQIPTSELHSIIKPWSFSRYDVVLPLEINLNTLRVLKQDDLPVDDYWNAMFDELNDLDSEHIFTLKNMIRQKESVSRSYNCRVREKCFSIGKLVLKVILPMEKKSRFLSKWSHTWEGSFQIIELYSRNAYRFKDIESGNVVNLNTELELESREKNLEFQKRLVASLMGWSIQKENVI